LHAAFMEFILYVTGPATGFTFIGSWYYKWM